MGKNIALFGIDPQNDFGHPKGSLYCDGGFKVIGGGMVLISHAREKIWLNVLSADSHPENSDHFQPKGTWQPHCVQSSWGAKFLPGINDTVNQEPIFYKGTRADEDGYNPFDGRTRQGYGPELFFRAFNVNKIVVWGIATNYCVRAFVLTARKKGYEVYVVLDACAAVPTPEKPPADFVTEQQAIEEMKAAGAIMTTVKKVIYELA